ncbi:MAG: hypothetical protein WAW96_18970 [Alphaproteobacteria bacterium]
MSSHVYRAALLALLCLSLAACAGDGHRRSFTRDAGVGTGPKADPVALFVAGLDSNLDGVVALDELNAAMPKLWASSDPSGAASISILELNSWRTHWFGSDDGWPGRFHFDTDGDGNISRKEFETGLKAVFDNFDVHKNGRITRDELLGPGTRGARSDADKAQNNNDDGERQDHRRRRPGGDGDGDSD